MTAVPATSGVAPLGLSPTSSSSLPPQRRPARLMAPWWRLAGGPGVAESADAVEASSAVQAASGVEAGPAGAVVQVDSAEAPSEAVGADAGETVDAVQAGGAIGTWLHQAVVHVSLTARPCEAHQAATHQLRRKAVSVLTQTTILTGRPGDKTHK